MQQIGILTGCDQNQEWLLSWWYELLRRNHPDLPIAFGDFGMTPEARTWCAERGTVFDAPSLSLPEEQEGWYYGGKNWIQDKRIPNRSRKQRTIWFRKPLLMKQTPFAKTLWLDLDCEVLGSLSPLFALPLNQNGMALRRGGGYFWVKAVGEQAGIRVKCGNSGVLLFEKNSPLLDLWIFYIEAASGAFDGDDHLLSFLIQTGNMDIPAIPFRYNWECKWGLNKELVVRHWVSEEAKHMLRLLI